MKAAYGRLSHALVVKAWRDPLSCSECFQTRGIRYRWSSTGTHISRSFDETAGYSRRKTACGLASCRDCRGAAIRHETPTVQEKTVPSDNAVVLQDSVLKVQRRPLRIPLDHVVVQRVMHVTSDFRIERFHRVHAVWPGSTFFGVFFSRWGVIFAGLSLPGTPRGPSCSRWTSSSVFLVSLFMTAQLVACANVPKTTSAALELAS